MDSNKVIRITSGTVLLFIIIIAVAVPLSYFLISYEYVRGNMDAEGALRTRDLNELIMSNPKLWQFEEIRIRGLLQNRKLAIPETYLVKDLQGNIVAEIVQPLREPLITRIYNLNDAGTLVGRLNITRSLHSYLKNAIIILVSSFSGGGILFLFLKAYPLRTIKRAYQTLEKNEERYRELYEHSPLGYQSLDADGRFIEVNQAWLDAFGYERGEVIGSWFGDFLTPGYVEVFRERFAHLKETGIVDYELEMKHKDGNVSIIALAGRVGYDEEGGFKQSHCILSDITERKHAEEELRESRRRWADIIEFLPDATLVIDRERTVIAWNRAMETMTGVMKEDMLGKGNFEYALPFYGERRPILIDLVLATDSEGENRDALQRTEEIISETYAPGIPPGGIHLYASASVLRDSKGNIIGAIECIRDITERVRTEERLHRAEKMEVLGRVAGGVAHDLNNVLGIMVGYAELLMKVVDVHDPLSRHLKTIMASGHKAAAIVQDFLTMAGKGFAIREPVNLNRIIADYLDTPEYLQLASQHASVSLKTDLDPRLTNISGSSAHLGKAVMNLINNAMEAIPNEGTVTIKTRNCHLETKVHGYEEIREGDYCVLSVSDTGEGISGEDIKNIFEPFYTTKQLRRSGSGLGLPVVWGVVKDHDGYIDVHSEKGKGSTFTLYFSGMANEEPTSIHAAADVSGYMGKGESF